jgi:hypothetical protein
MAAPVPARPERPWVVIAKEITSESDPSKVLHLAEELNRALAQQRPARSIAMEDTTNGDSNRIAS